MDNRRKGLGPKELKELERLIKIERTFERKNNAKQRVKAIRGLIESLFKAGSIKLVQHGD